MACRYIIVRILLKLEKVGAYRPRPTEDRIQNMNPSWLNQQVFGAGIPGPNNYVSHITFAAANNRRRQQIKGKPANTVRGIVAAVGSFERWLWTRFPSDQRQIFEIPLEELDGLLTQFYATINKPSGDEYNRESFIVLRSRLDSYLKDNGYPCSISKAPKFIASQEAFTARKMTLHSKMSVPYRQSFR